LASERIFLSPPHMSGLEEKYIHEAFDTNWIAPLGPNVDAFESALAQTATTFGAVALSSGTAAIHLALRTLNVERGDWVFCSTLTFVASSNPILYQGATPVFIESDEQSWNMCPEALRQAFTYADSQGKLPKAVIVTNLYGQSADMDLLLEICNQYDVPLIEDAAESLGAKYRGKPSGSFGYVGVFSFNGNKIITTSGGGALVSNNPEVLDKVRFLATQARDSARHYQHSELGYNYRLSNILAGVGRGQLSVLADRVEARRRIFDRYVGSLGDVHGITFMPEPEWSFSTRWLTVLLIDEHITGVNRDEIIKALEHENIESRPVWKPLHLQPLYDGCLYFSSPNGAVSERLFSTGLCLPSGSSLSEADQDRVVSVVHQLLSSRKIANKT